MNGYERNCESPENMEEMPQLLPPTCEDMAKSWDIVRKMKSRLEAHDTWIPITGDSLPKIELFDSTPCGTAEPIPQQSNPNPYYNPGQEGNQNYQKPGAGESSPPLSNPYRVHKPGVDI